MAHYNWSKLLICKTTGKNIIWATGDKDMHIRHISVGDIDKIKTRIEKNQLLQKDRTKTNAEVFTPSWLCNKMNNEIDSAWFGYDEVFNTECDKGWDTNYSNIDFKDKNWRDYVNRTNLEITCGEAPYLVSRYDTVSGEHIDIKDRIGLLDRKLRVIAENSNKDEYIKWVVKAYQSTYGYEFQGDNLFIARKNLLQTFIDNMQHVLSREPNGDELNLITNIIVWNIWQMDGLTYGIPYMKQQDKSGQQSFLEENIRYIPIYAKIKNWTNSETLLFKDLI